MVGTVVQLVEALGLGPGEVVAFVGAGGKTSALYRLAHELLAQSKRIVATTTTHMYPPAPEAGWPLVVAEDAKARLRGAEWALAEHGRAFVAATAEPDGRLVGIPPHDVEGLSALADVTLVEADGARGRWLKAPALHEPVIPESSTLVVPVAGLQAVGQPLDPPAVHRPERVASVLQCPRGSRISADMVARLLRDERGGLRGIPAQARVVALCNQADSPNRLVAGRRVAALVLRAWGRTRQVVVGAAQTPAFEWERWEPSTVVVLAAGAGERYGGLKLAHEWEGRPLLWRAVSAALSSLAGEVLVVLGYQADRLAPLLADCSSQRLRQVVNQGWEEGLASSVRAGVGALPEGVSAAVLCNADQPLLSGSEIDALLIHHAATGAPIVAPRYRGELRSPVLFARRLFPQLAALTGDVGGRVVVERFRDEVAWLEVFDPLPYEDVDTQADHLRLRRGRDNGQER